MEHNIKLTSSEMGTLWSSYMYESMSTCFLRFFLQHVDDKQVSTLLKHTTCLSEGRIKLVKSLLNQENFSVQPVFTDEDINLSAPRLFSDTFYLNYVDEMARGGISNYGEALSSSSRVDIRSFYTTCLTESVELRNKAVDLLLAKEMYMRSPFVSVSNKANRVRNCRFLGSVFGHRRPLAVAEISHLYLNIQRKLFEEAILVAFSQIAKSQKVRRYLMHGRDIAVKHIKTLTKILLHNNLPIPTSWGFGVTGSNTRTFSDKLIMYHTNQMSSISTVSYGRALGQAMRHDLVSTYTRMIREVEVYGESGAKIMMNNAWFKDPPHDNNRREIRKAALGIQRT